MAWLDLINERETRRLAKELQQTALQTRDMVQERLGQFAHQASAVSNRTAHDVADYGRHHGAEIARDTLVPYAYRAGDLSHQMVDYGRQEAAVLAQMASRQAARVARAAKADPVPMIVGAIGIAIFASLLLNRRARRD